MEQQRRVTLDSDVFRGRVRGYSPRPVAAYSGSIRRNHSGARINDIRQPQRRTLPPVDTKVNTQSTSSAPRSAQPVRAIAAPSQRMHVLITQKTASPPTRTSPKKARPKKRTIITASFAAVPILIGITLWGITLRTNHQIVSQVKAMQVTTASTDGGVSDSPTNAADYDETPPTNVGSYVVAPDLPRYIIIDKLDIKARVKRMGVGADNAVQTPKNIFDTGWYDGSAKPGETGATFINGHVSGPTQRGIFYKIKNLKTGDPIVIEKGDGSKLTYIVASSESFPANQVDMNKVLRPYGNAKKGLTLMTCGGSFDRTTQEYTERVVVYATLQ